MKKEFNFKIKDDLSSNCKDVESLNQCLNALYRPPNGQIESYGKFSKYVFSITKTQIKYAIL